MTQFHQIHLLPHPLPDSKSPKQTKQQTNKPIAEGSLASGRHGQESPARTIRRGRSAVRLYRKTSRLSLEHHSYPPIGSVRKKKEWKKKIQQNATQKERKIQNTTRRNKYKLLPKKRKNTKYNRKNTNCYTTRERKQKKLQHKIRENK